MKDKTSEAPTRDLHPWLAWEDALLLDCSFGFQYFSAQDVALELSRDPLRILRRILETDIPEMVGFPCEPGSEEEAEFLALGLAGAPLELMLRWCTATQDQEDRPDWDELAMYLTADLRAATALAREAGLWFTGSHQLEALVYLSTQALDTVKQTLCAVLDRVDAPTPVVVAQQLLGDHRAEAPIDWCNPFTERRKHSSGRRTKAGRSRRQRGASTGHSGSYHPRRKLHPRSVV